MARKLMLVMQVLVIMALLLSACAPAATEAPTEVATEAATEEATEAATEEVTEVATEVATEVVTEVVTEEPFTAPEGTLVSVLVETAPTLDGVADESFWADAPAVVVPVNGGANTASTEVTVKSVYDGSKVYFVASWADPTESFIRSPWVKQEDGSWAMLKDPNDKGGDNNLNYEDKLSFIWPIANSIPNFETAGCFTACHAGENSDVKPYGNKYTAEEGQMGDIWHWKSVRNLGQIDDQYLDSTRYSADAPGAGRKSDPKDGGGYSDNQTEDKTMPAFMLPEGAAKDGAPGYILDSEKVPFDDSKFVAGDMVPSVIISEITGDRGNISAQWLWADGVWTIEFSRDLVTGSEFDVQFEDLSATYYFGVATFDNAQVRHSFQTGVTPFVFKP